MFPFQFESFLFINLRPITNICIHLCRYLSSGSSLHLGWIYIKSWYIYIYIYYTCLCSFCCVFSTGQVCCSMRALLRRVGLHCKGSWWQHWWRWYVSLVIGV